MGHSSSTNYARRAKQGLLIGAALFAIGAIGEIAGHAVLGGMPGWTETLLLDAEILGVVVGLFSPLVFGVALPLID